jgi:hypothetical protein
MARDSASIGARVLALLGLVLSVPVLAFAWPLALLALTHGVPSDDSQFGMGIARELTLWGVAEAGLGTLGLAAGIGEWLSGRGRRAAWLFWSPLLLLLLTLIALQGYVFYVRASGAHR